MQHSQITFFHYFLLLLLHVLPSWAQGHIKISPGGPQSHKLLDIWIYISGITQDQPNVHMLEGEGTTRHFKTGEYFSFINSLHFWIQWQTTRSVCTETKETSCVSTNHSVTEIINNRQAAICNEASAFGRGGKLKWKETPNSATLTQLKALLNFRGTRFSKFSYRSNLYKGATAPCCSSPLSAVLTVSASLGPSPQH